MTIAQRIRELATLRTLGASRTADSRVAAARGSIIGLIASVGVLLGLVLAKALTALFEALGLGLPDAPTVFEPRRPLSGSFSASSSRVATISPALRATRVPPIAAVREAATSAKRAQPAAEFRSPPCSRCSAGAVRVRRPGRRRGRLKLGFAGSPRSPCSSPWS